MDGRERLLDVIAGVRRRWRMKIVLRGLLITVTAALVLFVLASYGLERMNFAATAVITFRVLAGAALVGLAIRFLVLPLRRRVSDEQVALYLEEHEPTLQNTLISALESGSAAASPALTRRTVEHAIERCRQIEDGRNVDRVELNRFATAFSAIAVVGIVMTLFAPPLLRHGADALLNPFRAAADVNPYRIAVEPGDATIARGADQIVTAFLSGWESRGGQGGVAQQVEILMRPAGDTTFQRIPLTPTEDASRFEVLLFDVATATEYYIEADGISSALYRIDVADLPYVDRIDLEYAYPDYTGLPNEVFEDAGDIVALRGSLVTVRARTTMPVTAARILLEDGTSIEMQPEEDGVVAGSIRINAEGFYTIELTATDGTTLSGSPRYLIDVLDDRGPSVRLSRPGHDIRPTTIEEVFVEASAEDDFGVARLELVYSVNGGAETAVTLLSTPRPLPEASAGHTFYLEELDLKPGDLVSYYARATDNGARGGRVATSDIFFMNIRPFGRDYRQAEQAGGGGGGGGEQGESPGELSEQQRQIITATFNLIRDSASYAGSSYAENLNTITLMQDRLREQVNTLRQRMLNRQITRDTMFAKIAEILPLAVTEMDAALVELRRARMRDALGAEQRSLQQLQRAEALYREVQVAFDQQGGGGGGGAAPNAEDLADLFELERDRLRNQYESVQRGERQQPQSQNEVDAALERLRELARRQEQENERLRQQAQARQNQQGGGGGAQSQRQLADETEQTARQLERLSRETQQQSLADVARRLQQAADEMRRSAANARSGNTAQANNALNQLEEARRRLERSRTESLEQQTQQALQQAEQLARDQRQLAERMSRLQNLSGGARNEEARSIIDEKGEQVERVAELERQLDRLAQGSRSEQRDASRQLQEAANDIRDSQLKERIRFSRNFAYAAGQEESSRVIEQQIADNIDNIRERIAGAAGAIGASPEQRAGETLDRLRRMARGLESMQERTAQAESRSQAESQQDGEQGQGQQGQDQQGQGQQGQQGQQGGQGGQGGQTDAGGQSGGASGGRGAIAGGGSRAGIAPEDARQLRNEVRERLAEAQALRRQLAGEGRDVAELDNVIRGMRALEAAGVWSNAAEVQRLQAAVVDGLKQYEFGLRRTVLGGDRDQLYLSGTDEVPEGFRKMVEEYYRALARER